MTLSFQKLFYTIAVVFALFAILILGKPVLISLSLALLISFILLPMAKKFECYGMNRIVAAFLSILAFYIIIGVAIYLFTHQIAGMTNDMKEFEKKVTELISNALVYINDNFNLKTDLKKEDIFKKTEDFFSKSAMPIVQTTFNSTATILTGLLTTTIYTFLLLIYRQGLTWSFMQFAPADRRERILNMLKNIQKVGQMYLSGMMKLILILGFANSIGLLIIGIDSPFFFGFLAAIMSIIPFVGTTLGAAIPVLYAFISEDSLWKPLAVAIMFWGIQVVESNFLSPKVVGSSMHVNALAAFLSLIIGASVWGVAGMILFLPFAAMLKVVCEEFEPLKPVGLLIGNELYTDEEENVSFRKQLGKFKNWVKKIFKKG